MILSICLTMGLTKKFPSEFLNMLTENATMAPRRDLVSTMGHGSYDHPGDKALGAMASYRSDSVLCFNSQSHKVKKKKENVRERLKNIIGQPLDTMNCLKVPESGKRFLKIEC